MLGYLGYLGSFVQPNLFLQNRAKQLSPFGEFSNNNLFLMDFKLHTYGLKYYWNLEFKKNIQDSQNHGFDNPRFMAYQIRKCQVEYCRIRPSRIGHSQTEKGCLITGKAIRERMFENIYQKSPNLPQDLELVGELRVKSPCVPQKSTAIIGKSF